VVANPAVSPKIASIEDPEVIARILAHRRERGAEDPPVASLGAL